MKRILIIDDEKTVVDVLKEGFKKFEDIFETDTAYTGEDAIEKIKKRKYDLVISDIRLPGKSGIDVLIELKKKHPEAGYIAMTAFSSPEVEEKVKNLGGLKYIEKPFSFKMLKQLVLDFLKEDNSGVRGVVESVQLTSILQLMNMEKKTCVLWVELHGTKGYLAFEEGNIVDAKFGSLKGLDAAKYIIQRNEGEIRIDTKKKAKKKTIDIPFMNLLLDTMKEKDEKERGLVDSKDFEGDKTDIDLSFLKEKLEKELMVFREIKGFINAGIFNSKGECLFEIYNDKKRSLKKTSHFFVNLFNKALKAIAKVGFGILNTVQVDSEKGILFSAGVHIEYSRLIILVHIGINGNVGLTKKYLGNLIQTIEEEIIS